MVITSNHKYVPCTSISRGFRQQYRLIDQSPDFQPRSSSYTSQLRNSLRINLLITFQLSYDSQTTYFSLFCIDVVIANHKLIRNAIKLKGF
jgi:hypothetical protein